jgi:DNA (cytosine-5)-methyltransferase 1
VEVGAMTRPRLLDLFSGAGGAARGYQMAGFHVTGIDIKPQSRYAGDVFIQGDALEYVRAHGREFDAIHASPPCQRYSRGSKQHASGERHPDLIAATRAALLEAGRPYVIENVADARGWLRWPILLCGAMFPGLRTYRHRLFESSAFLLAPSHPRHAVRSPRSNVYVDGLFMTVYGHVTPMTSRALLTGVDWPMTQKEVAEAIPPAYCEFIGAQLLAAIHTKQTA